MKKKFNRLIDRHADQELKAYFSELPSGKPLDVPEELALLENCSEDVWKAYFRRFRFSEKAEKVFLMKASAEVRLSYINQNGLSLASQHYIINENMVDIADDFLRLRSFECVDYLLENGSSSVIFSHIRRYPFDKSSYVEKLLFFENRSLFNAYVQKGYFISEDIQKLIIEKENLSAFTALVYRNYRNFKKKGRTMTYQQMLDGKVANVFLSEELQLKVLDSNSARMIEKMLLTTPLYPSIQKEMFERRYDVNWLKLHVVALYACCGYRFEPEYEVMLFKKLASKNLDDCLTTFRHRDDVTFVKSASFNAVEKYIKDYWLSDEAQVELINRGNADIIGKFISRFTPEHGMCWQAEVALVNLGASEQVEQYISFHSMCATALNILQQKNPKLHAYYYTKHAY